MESVLSQSDKPLHLEVAVEIDEQGRVRKAELYRAEGSYSHLFVESVLVAAQRSRFAPATLNGRPVSSKQILNFNFKRPRR